MTAKDDFLFWFFKSRSTAYINQSQSSSEKIRYYYEGEYDAFEKILKRLDTVYHFFNVKKNVITAPEVRGIRSWLHIQIMEKEKFIRYQHKQQKLLKIPTSESLDFYYGQHEAFVAVYERLTKLWVI